ncbi:MAG: PAS domain-containing protein [candidate division Zixibacteria bacterium]|nr:PAS domain-containing protein [candidate division Zixibacteria bacterium]
MSKKSNSGKLNKTDNPILTELFRQAIDLFDDAVYIIDKSYNILFYNQTFKKLSSVIGISEEDLKQPLTTAYAFRSESIIQQCQQVFSTGKELSNQMVEHVGGAVVMASIKRVPIKVSGKTEYIVNVVRDTSKVEAIKEEALDERKVYNAVFFNLPIGISVRDPNGTLLSHNDAWKKIWGHDDSEIEERIGRKREQLSFDESDSYLGEWAPRVEDIYTTGGHLFIPAIELYSEKKNEKIWVSQRFYAIQDEHDKVERVVILTEDLSEQKLSDKALQASEEKFSQLVASLPMIVAIVDYDGTLSYINEFGAAIRGAKAEDIIGTKFQSVLDKKTGRERLDSVRQAIDSGEKFYGESHVIINGEDIWQEAHILPYTEGDSTVVKALVIANNITERKKAERDLQQSEAKYRVLVESLPITLAVIDYNGIMCYINDFGAERRGAKAEDIIGTNFQDIYSDEKVKQESLNNIRRVIDSGEKLFDESHAVMHGVEKWYEAYLAPYPEDGSMVKKALVIANDVTERRKAERDLLESEIKYRVLMRNIPDNIAVFDESGTLLFINKYGAKSFNTDPDSIIGQTQWDIFPKEVADRQMATIRQVIESQQSITVDSNYVMNGKEHWFTTNIQPYRNLTGGISGAMIIATDITEAKIAQQALQSSEEKLRSTISSMDDLVFVLDKDLIFVEYYQPKKKKILYKEPIEFIGKYIGDIVPKEATDKLIAAVDNIVETGEVQQFDYSLDINNDRQWYNASVSRYRGPGDTYEGIIVVARNITDRKLIEYELIETKQELEDRVKKRTKELGEANDALRVEREALYQKNIALQEILGQIEKGKQQMSAGVQANIDRIVMPILETLDNKVSKTIKTYISLLRENLVDITSPFINRLESDFAKLTQRELEICNNIKNGLSSKEIASNLEISVQTVLKQRTIIRRKLGLSNKKVNLASFLKSKK